MLQLGSATATSGAGDFAIALGPSSAATATGGIFDAAYALGAHSAATATGGNLDFATLWAPSARP